MEAIQDLLHDTRPIYLLQFSGEHGGIVKVGEPQGITRIVAYGEPGEMCYLPWFAVYVGDEMIERINATDVCLVQYRESV